MDENTKRLLAQFEAPPGALENEKKTRNLFGIMAVALLDSFPPGPDLLVGLTLLLDILSLRVVVPDEAGVRRAGELRTDLEDVDGFDVVAFVERHRPESFKDSVVENGLISLLSESNERSSLPEDG